MGFPSNGTMLSWQSTSSTYSVRSTKVRIWLLSLHSCSALMFSLAGGKGRSAFCQTPAAISKDKDKRKDVDYSEYPLTRHGEMLYLLMQSGISGYPHKTVAMQFFETAARYGDFFKVRKECIVPTLQAMLDTR